MLLIGGTLSVLNVVVTSVGLERVQNSNKRHGSSSPTVKFSGVIASDPSRDERNLDENKKSERGRETKREKVHSKRPGSLKKKKSRDMHRDGSPISELPPDAVVINLGDSDEEQLPTNRFDGEDDEEVRRRHDRYSGSGRRREHLHEKESRWERHKPHAHIRLRKRERHRTSESGVRERGILKRTVQRDRKVRDGSRNGRTKDRAGWSDRKGARPTKKKKRRHKHDKYEVTRKRVMQI